MTKVKGTENTITGLVQGWVCPQCNIWVYGNDSHTCIPTTFPIYTKKSDHEILSTLRDIRTLLQKIYDKS